MTLRLGVLVLGWGPSSHLANINNFFKDYDEWGSLHQNCEKQVPNFKSFTGLYKDGDLVVKREYELFY